MVATSFLQNKQTFHNTWAILSSKWSSHPHYFTALLCYYPEYYGNAFFRGDALHAGTQFTPSQLDVLEVERLIQFLYVVKNRVRSFRSFFLDQHYYLVLTNVTAKNSTNMCYAVVAEIPGAKYSFQTVAFSSRNML